VKPLSPSVLAARAEAVRARTRLMGTVDELQHQLAPRTLMRGAWDSAKDKGADLAENAVDAVRKRPVAATGIVAAIAMFIAREPLMDLAQKAVGKGTKTSKRTRSKKPTESIE